MAGVAIQVDLRELDRLQRRLDSFWGQVRDPGDLLAGIAGLLEAQTKRRIADEKTAPDGTRWPEWSDTYAKTRKGKHSLLIDSQSLLDDIAGVVDGETAVVGSSMVYAATHQEPSFGPSRSGLGRRARPFLGLSHANTGEILQLVQDWIEGEL